MGIDPATTDPARVDDSQYDSPLATAASHTLVPHADLLAALKSLLAITGSASPTALCHVGICPMEECRRCASILAAQGLIARVEGKE